MSFLKLYQFAEAKAAAALSGEPARDDLGRVLAPVGINDILEVIVDLGHIQEAEIHGVILDPLVSLGHIKLVDLREERYDDQLRVARIRFHEVQTNCWIRFVICKELMHVFDSEEEAVFDVERFKRLLREIETPPMGGDESPMYTSEHDAEWMALLVLCPKEHRDLWKIKLQDGDVDEMTVAQRFRIPKDTVLALCSDYYDEVYNRLVFEAAKAEAEAVATPDPNTPLAANG